MKNNHQKSIIKLKQLKIEEQGSLENTDGTDYSSDSYELDIDVNQTYESDNDQERVKKKKCLSPIMKHWKTNALTMYNFIFRMIFIM